MLQRINKLRLASFTLLLLVGAPGFATPPTPPAQLSIDAEAIARLSPRDGRFSVPVRVVQGEGVSGLVVNVRLVTTDPIKPVEVERERLRIDQKDRAGMKEVRIPAAPEDGVYRVEIDLSGSIDDGREGIIDRAVLYLIREGGRHRLVLPVDLRREQTQRLQGEFHKRLTEAPDRPDVRLLSPATVRVPDELARTAVVLDDRPAIVVRGAGPSEEIRRYTVDRTEDAWAESDPITVRGRIVYLDFEGTWRPMVNVSVNVYDDDTFGDEHLGTTVTDWSGNWSFSVNNDDGWLQDGRDIYYKFHLGNTRWDVHDDDGDQYRWQSAVVGDVSDGTVIDYGSETGSTNATAMQVFGIINLGWDHITSAGGQDPGYIEIKHPTSKTFHSGGVVNITSGDNDGPDTILHEYGHGLMYRAFGNTSISPGGAHGFDDDSQDPGLAYSEGWASGFMLSLCPDGMYNWHEGSSEGPGEWPVCSNQSDTGRSVEQFSDGGNRVGERNEGRVAAAINDFRDVPNDDNGGSENRGRGDEEDANSGNRVSLATVYRDSMWGYVHDDFVQFWIMFAGNLSGTTRTRADDIMQYNWMSVPIEVSCVASKVTASQSENAESLLDGLRSFRDGALKQTTAGRRWIQAYYSHSPELAGLLLGDRESRKSALVIIENFSRLGSAISSRAEMERLIDADTQLMPPHVKEAIDRIAKLINERGSPELQKELGVLLHDLESIEDMSLREILLRAERKTSSKKDALLPTVDPSQLNDASRKADWDRIRQYLSQEEQ